MDLTAALETITPAMAADMLTQNRQNRHIQAEIVRAFIRDMQAGRWQIDGNPIRFNGDGTLLDGQHRLTACVESGVPITTFVVRGLAQTSQTVMDSGKARTIGDHLSMNGEKQPTVLAAVARIAVNYDRGAFQTIRSGVRKVTNSEALDWIAQHPEVRAAAEHASKHARQTDTTTAIVGFTTWRLAQIDSDEAFLFWIDAAERVGLTAGDPVGTMVRRFADARRQREAVSTSMYLSAVFRVWNARRAGRTLSRLILHDNRTGFLDIPEPR